ncbi:MAG: RDD family protein [Trueperaceae bacterium]|nr:RDD family protein [Truepera sp.]HRN17717.1 RDD family protein [Trueperaceae bacterium]HRQ10238.1 RDD family protein [Trueperaceae bacterium]
MSDQAPSDRNPESDDHKETPPVPPIPPVPPVPPVAPPEGAAPAGPEAQSKPDVGKRAIAYIIDAVIAGVLSALPVIGSLLGFAYILTRDGFDFDFMDGRSLGKKLMKLRVVREDGGKMDLTTSIKRNWTLALGSLGYLVVYAPFLGIIALTLLLSLVGAIVGLIEIYLVLTAPDGRRYGDRFAGTHVIESDS